MDKDTKHNAEVADGQQKSQSYGTFGGRGGKDKSTDHEKVDCCFCDFTC